MHFNNTHTLGITLLLHFWYWIGAEQLGIIMIKWSAAREALKWHCRYIKRTRSQKEKSRRRHRSKAEGVVAVFQPFKHSDTAIVVCSSRLLLQLNWYCHTRPNIRPFVRPPTTIVKASPPASSSAYSSSLQFVLYLLLLPPIRGLLGIPSAKQSTTNSLPFILRNNNLLHSNPPTHNSNNNNKGNNNNSRTAEESTYNPTTRSGSE